MNRMVDFCVVYVCILPINGTCRHLTVAVVLAPLILTSLKVILMFIKTVTQSLV